MASLTSSYEYRDGNVYAVFEGRVIASGTEFARVAETATEYLDSLTKQRKEKADKEARSSATHIETPNGMKGQIISRTASVWGDEITVRFENNQIRRFETTAGLKFSKEEAAVPSNYREALQTILDRTPEPTREGLTARLKDLGEIRTDAAQHVAHERSLSEQKALHRMILAAEAETQEIQEALAHLDAIDAENAAPAAPTYAAVEQVSLGHGANDNWLDVVSHEMIAESEAEDLNALLEEGPTKLVSSLDDASVHNAGTVRDIAASHVISKTAGFTGDEVESYREAFVAKAETARRRELTYRQENQKKETAVKEASIEGVPDEAMFL